jgi:ectoine hydroxylase-related dioxygenase (phytanoyl-CoA dioxygenase family)
MKPAIFQNSEIQNQFDEKGFVKLKILDHQIIKDLRSYCLSEFPVDNKAFFSSSYLNDFEKKKAISDFIIDEVQASFDKEFINHKALGAAFLIKGSGDHSEMPMHQDWSIVDESKYYALNIWIPLIETNETNGCLEVIKGSHLWNENLRAPTIPFFLNGHQEKLKKHFTQIPTEIGEVIILNQAVIHYSKPNHSTEIRPAITVGLVSSDAPLSLHYWDKDNPQVIEEFEQKDDFLLRFEDFHTTIFQKPVLGKSAGKYPFTNSGLTEQVKSIIEDCPLKGKRSFLHKLFNKQRK